MAGKIKKSDLQKIIDHNRKLRQLLKEWPARKIMMDYEKDWNERRQRLLSEQVPEDL